MHRLFVVSVLRRKDLVEFEFQATVGVLLALISFLAISALSSLIIEFRLFEGTILLLFNDLRFPLVLLVKRILDVVAVEIDKPLESRG